MNMDINDVTQLAVNTLDTNRDGTIEVAELAEFISALTDELGDPEASGPGTPGATDVVATNGAPSALSALATSAHPAHDLKVTMNDTLVAVARDLGLTITTIPGANYPAVAELIPEPDGSLSSEQASLRRQITELVTERMANDPALPANMTVRVENLDAGSGADRIAISTGGEELVFDVITGKGILKTRIAKNYVADISGQSVERAHSQQFELMGNLAGQLARSAEAYRQASSLIPETR